MLSSEQKRKGVLVRCAECGSLIKGRTLIHAKANLKLHKKSKHHKTQTRLKASGSMIVKE